MKNKKATIIVLLFITILLSITGMIIARYRSAMLSSIEADVAFYVFETDNISQTLKLDSMVPRDELYNYNINVSNEKNGIVTKTPMEYTIRIKTTTNLPLKYYLYDEDGKNLIDNREIIQDSNGVYYIIHTTNIKEIGLKKEIHTYKLSIEFSKEYKANYEYADIIELVEITIDSKQKIEE